MWIVNTLMGTFHDENVTNLGGCRIYRAFTVCTILVLPAEPPLSSGGGCLFFKGTSCKHSFFLLCHRSRRCLFHRSFSGFFFWWRLFVFKRNIFLLVFFFRFSHRTTSSSFASTVAEVTLISSKDGPDTTCSWSPVDANAFRRWLISSSYRAFTRCSRDSTFNNSLVFTTPNFRWKVIV